MKGPRRTIRSPSSQQPEQETADMAHRSTTRTNKAIGGITHTTGVCGGRACLAGRRFPVWLLCTFWQDGATDAELIRNYQGELTQLDLDTARAYARSHAAEIAHDLQVLGESTDWDVAT